MRCEVSQYSLSFFVEFFVRDACYRHGRVRRATDRLIPRVNPIGLNLPSSDFPKFLLTPPPNHQYNPPHPVPQRGVSGSSETRGGMRWTRQRQA
jgi:hypothetical protein